MSYPALSWAIRQRLDPIPRLVLLALADRADKRGLCWPSVAWLADFCGFHRATIMRELKRLQRAQLIEQTGDRKGITNQVRVYRLRLDEDGLPLPMPEPERRKGSPPGDTSERGKCRSIGDTLNGLKVSLNGATVSEVGKSRSGATGSSRRPVAPNAGKGRSGATRNQLEPVNYPLHAGAGASAAIFAEWNRMASASGLSIARTLTPDRRKELNDRIAEHGAEIILAAIGTVPASPFLTGDNPRGWKADFDYFVSSRGMNKVVDGAFVDGQKAKG
jgi:hypothetical protein